MDLNNRKTLLYAGGGGAALALLYLATRGGGGASAGSAGGPTASGDTGVLEGLYRELTRGYEGAVKELRGETTEQFKEIRAEQKEAFKAAAEAEGEKRSAFELAQKGLFEQLSGNLTALIGAETTARQTFETGEKTAREAFAAEQKGLLDALSVSLDKALAGLTRQIGAITKRVTGLETTAAKLTAENKAQQKALEEQAANITGQQKTLLDAIRAAVSAEEKARKEQAGLVAGSSRIAAAQAAGFTNLFRWGTSQTPELVSKTTEAITVAYGLTASEKEQVRTWLQQQSGRFSRGEIGGSGGISWLPPIIPGPMGFRVMDTIAGSRAVSDPRLDPRDASPSWGIH